MSRPAPPEQHVAGRVAGQRIVAGIAVQLDRQADAQLRQGVVATAAHDQRAGRHRQRQQPIVDAHPDIRGGCCRTHLDDVSLVRAADVKIAQADARQQPLVAQEHAFESAESDVAVAGGLSPAARRADDRRGPRVCR